MSIFSSLFGGSENQDQPVSNVNWIPLTDLGQLNEIITLSETQPVLIFKHSTTCGISRMAMKQFESQFDLNDQVVSYYLDLLTYRSISNEVAARFGVEHQSPQLLLIQDGKCVFDTSHGAIDVSDLRAKFGVR
jgi:bacillithiol system protein YtxJ